MLLPAHFGHRVVKAALVIKHKYIHTVYVSTYIDSINFTHDLGHINYEAKVSGRLNGQSTGNMEHLKNHDWRLEQEDKEPEKENRGRTYLAILLSNGIACQAEMPG